MCPATSEAHIGSMNTTFPNTNLTTFIAADRAAVLRSDAQRRRTLRRLTRSARRNSLRSP